MSFDNITLWGIKNQAITNADGHTSAWFNVGSGQGFQFFSKWTGASTVTYKIQASPCRANNNGADALEPGDFYEELTVVETATTTFQWHDPPDELDRPVQSIRFVIATSGDITAAYFGCCRSGVGP